MSDDMTIREIAQLWEVDVRHLHHEYAKARREFVRALRDVVADHHRSMLPCEIDRCCRELLDLIRPEEYRKVLNKFSKPCLQIEKRLYCKGVLAGKVVSELVLIPSERKTNKTNKTDRSE